MLKLVGRYHLTDASAHDIKMMGALLKRATTTPVSGWMQPIGHWKLRPR